MKIGERINPHKLWVGSFVPNWLLQRKDISMGAKLVYARLCQFAGDDGRAFPKLETLADEVGSSLSAVKRSLEELKTAGLIESRQRGLNQSNDYFFLSHRWMVSFHVGPKSGFPDSPKMGRQDSPKSGYIRESEEENQSKRATDSPATAQSNPAQSAGTPPAWPKVKSKDPDPERWSYSGPPLVDALPRARGGRRL